MLSYLPLPLPALETVSVHAMRTLLAVIFLTLLPLPAAVAADLYSGEIAVADQGASERGHALPLALQQVLGKLSGLRSFEGFPQVEPALDSAESLLLSYHYDYAESLRSDGSEVRELRLVARFSPPALDRLARQLELPLWPPERAPITAWMVIDDGLERRVFPVDFQYLRSALEDTADRRGLRLAWPIPGEDGVYAIDEQLLWGGYTEDIAAADGADVLIMAARREGARWSLRLNLGAGGQHRSWRREDADLEQGLVAGLEEVIDQLAADATIAAEDLGSWSETIVVAGVTHPADYRRCLELLQGISFVRQVRVASARPGEVSFRLDLNVAPRYLEEALTAGGGMEPGESPGEWLLLPPVPAGGEEASAGTAETGGAANE